MRNGSIHTGDGGRGNRASIDRIVFRYVLACVFLVSAAAKSFQPGETISVLVSTHHFTAEFATAVLMCVIVVEFVVAGRLDAPIQ